jgi:cytochrome c5
MTILLVQGSALQLPVCLEGQSCGQATAMNVAAVGGARSAESIYTSGCAACHDGGVAGAPMMGNKSPMGSSSSQRLRNASE